MVDDNIFEFIDLISILIGFLDERYFEIEKKKFSFDNIVLRLQNELGLSTLDISLINEIKNLCMTN